MTADRLRLVLRLDGWGCVALGLVVAVGAAALAGPLGLDAPWPVAAAGALLALYGLDVLLVARRPTPGRVRALVAADLLFALGVAALAGLDPTGAAVGARGALAALAVGSALLGTAKLVGADTLRSGDAPAAAPRRAARP